MVGGQKHNTVHYLLVSSSSHGSGAGSEACTNRIRVKADGQSNQKENFVLKFKREARRPGKRSSMCTLAVAEAIAAACLSAAVDAKVAAAEELV